LKVYDIIGREIAALISENQVSGYYQIPWNANGIPSGVYYYCLQTGNFRDTKKLILLK
jgi:hypothetical protein